MGERDNGRNSSKQLQWIPVAHGVEVLVDVGKTQRIDFRFEPSHDAMGDVAYDTQPVVTTEHKATVRIARVA